jgi:hypothetical protein
MPSGYTADIKDGISFKTFALNCARAFGACVELRDEPGGGDRIPESFAPSDYHTKALDKARADLAALGAMTPAELERGAAKAYDDAETNRTMQLREIAGQRAAYEAMLAKVQAWVPPTEEHKGMQQFMAKQITESIRFDCGGDYYATPTVRLTGPGWAEKRRAALARDLDYHAEKHAEEVKRAESRTAWVAALRASL